MTHETINLAGLLIPAGVIAMAPARLCRYFRVVPVRVESEDPGSLIIVFATDGELTADDLRTIANQCRVAEARTVAADADELSRAIGTYYRED